MLRGCLADRILTWKLGYSLTHVLSVNRQEQIHDTRADLRLTDPRLVTP